MNTGDQKSGAPTQGSSLLLLAAASAIASAFLFTASHGIVRHVGSTLHPFEVAFFSTLFSALFYVPLILRNGFGIMATQKIRLHVVRAFFNAAALVAWYMALSMVQLADATALALAGPLFATLGAALFLGERIHLRRWSALIVGAFGALVIIRPGFETISIGFLVVLASAASSAVAKLFAKHLTRWDSAVTCSAYVAILQMPITLALALPVWQAPNLRELGWLAVVGVFVALAQMAMVQAFKMADVGAIEPLNFTRIVWATSIGFFAFGEIPGLWTWIGAAIIVAASTYIARRESRAAAKDDPASRDRGN